MFIIFVLLSFLIETAENNFSLKLFDTYNEGHIVSLNFADLNMFSVLKTGFEYNKNSLLQWNFEDVSYEVFSTILKPLADTFQNEEVDYQISMLPDKIRESKNISKNTKQVIDYMKTSNILLENSQTAYFQADFLQMPFAIKRGIANYCYDLGLPVFDAFDNKNNKKSLLISNRDFDIRPTEKNELHRFNGFYKFFDYSNKEIRFFDNSSAALIKKDCLPNLLYCYFDFSNNKIQLIDLDDLTKTIGNLDLKSRDFGSSELSEADRFVIQKDKPVFDFQKNTTLSLSNVSHNLEAINFSVRFNNVIIHLKKNYEEELLNFNNQEKVQKRLFFSKIMYRFVIGYLFSSGLVFYIKGRNNFIKNSFKLSMLGVVFQFHFLYKSFKDAIAKITKRRDDSKDIYEQNLSYYEKLLAEDKDVLCYLVDELYYIIIDNKRL